MTQLDLVAVQEAPLERGLALAVGMLAELKQHNRAQALSIRRGDKQGDGSGDPALCSKPPQATRNGRRRQGDLLGKLNRPSGNHPAARD